MEFKLIKSFFHNMKLVLSGVFMKKKKKNRCDHIKDKANTGCLASSARSWKRLQPQRYRTETVSRCEGTPLMLQTLGRVISQAAW